MNVTIIPGTARGTVASPASKSVAHRLLICAGLADGVSTVRGITLSDDLLATVGCLNALGAECTVDGDTVRVRGTLRPGAGESPLDCRESAGTLRFLIPVAALGSRPATFCGSEKLFSRPLGVYRTLFEERGLPFSPSANSVTVRGPLSGGTYRFPGDQSSQFVSGLLFALPLATADSRIELLPPVESAPYIELTRDVLQTAGIRTERDGEHAYVVPGGQSYRPFDLCVEGDESAAANFRALNLIGGDVRVTGLNPHTRQGDRVCVPLLESLRNGFCEIDLSDCPDLGPVSFVAAALSHGAHFTGTRRLRLKESDRVASMTEELEKCGVRTEVGENDLTVFPGAGAPRTPLSGHGDHRVVMALSVLLTAVGGTMTGAEAVKKSYPGFFRDLSSLGIDLRTDCG